MNDNDVKPCLTFVEMYENCVDDDDGDNNGGNQVRDDPDNGSPSNAHFASVILLVAFSYLMCM